MNIYGEIRKILRELGGEDTSFALSVPEDKNHGDIATNIAFALAKKEGKSPKETAENLRGLLLEKLGGVVSQVEVAGPGFINFFIKPEVARDASLFVGKVETKFTGKHILVEHSSPNLFKPFHIGHLMNNIVGEFLTRSVKVSGSQVETLCFPSDISFGIAKAVYVLEMDGGFDQSIFLSGNRKDIVTYFGDCYVRGVVLFTEKPELEVKMREVSKKIYSAIGNPSLQHAKEYELWKKAGEINVAYFVDVLESIGSHMGKPIFESEVSGVGAELVRKNTPKIFTESEGAIVYIPGEERKDINTSVFINREGHPTYEAKDLGLIERKFSLYKETDISFFVTDIEQSQHFKVVLDAASKLGGEWPSRVEKSVHVPHGRMLFKGQKMSSRLGGVPLALDVISVVEEEVRERAGEKIANYSQEEKEKITREIALSALRVAVLRSKPGLNINFDPETSLSFEGDSGPYLLYTHARCFSLLEKGGHIAPSFSAVYELGTLERTLLHCNEVLTESIEDIAPQKLVTYLFKVAQELNSFYGREQIISDDSVKTAHNLAIILWTKEVLKQGLFVLGIEAVERM